MNLIVPPALHKGDKIALLSTARKISADALTPIQQVFSDWGLQVVRGKTLDLEHHQFAGTEKERLEDLQWALDEEGIKAVFCVRGGYGTVQIIDRLDFTCFAQHPKWVVGYSDITVLHSHLHTQLQTASLHATMPINYAENTPQSLESLYQALFSSPPDYLIEAHPLNRYGKASGTLIGGNLSLLYAMIGTPSDLQTKGKILFIEDLDEYLYHIDRMMNALQRSGKLHELAALIVGGMTDMNDNTIPFGETAYEIIARHAAPYGFPVAFGFPAGHQSDNRTLVLGKTVSLEVTPQFAKLDYAH